MSFYICRQCASSAHALRKAAVRVATGSKVGSSSSAPTDTQHISSLVRSLLRPRGSSLTSRLFSTSTPLKSRSAEAEVTSPSIPSSVILSRRSKISSVPPNRPSSPSGKDKETPRSRHINVTRRRIDKLIKRLDVDHLYLEFWKICSLETLKDQREIWQTNTGFGEMESRQESLYRAFNTQQMPKHTEYPEHKRKRIQGNPVVPASRLLVKCDDVSNPGRVISGTSDIRLAGSQPMMHTLAFLNSSHAKRLLQMHQYFEQVLGLKIAYYAKIALLVAFSIRGDMVTVHKLFRQWRDTSTQYGSSSTKQGQQRQRKTHPGPGGKEMYSAIIRGVVGRNFQEPSFHPFYVIRDNATGTRNCGVTQMYAALELFYDLLRRGGTPTFETYHSLVVGMSTFKNDMEAAELLLDHMIITKKRPYVQVLHVMCREYVRRKEFPAAERIFGMLKEYGIRPMALTCNLMLKAVFQLSTADTLLHLGSNSATTSVAGPNHQLGLPDEDVHAKAQQLKRQKIQELRHYMEENGAVPDETTYSTLFYGFGHMEDGYPDLRSAMVEMTRREGSKVEPTLIVLNSLLFAHLNHGKIKVAESILDQMLQSTHSVTIGSPLGRRQLRSPFLPSKAGHHDGNGLDDAREARSTKVRRTRMVPGKGTFHALMLAYVEQGDIAGMERVLDKMIQIRRDMKQGQVPYSRLEADEYTANIMLLGYLTQGDLDKVEHIERQIHARQDWATSSLFLERKEHRQQLVEFVRQQGSKVVVEQIVQKGALSDDDLRGDRLDPTGAAHASSNPTNEAKAEIPNPLSGNVDGELDDDIEIDVTTLSTKLRGLLKSSSTSPSPPSSLPSKESQ
ncbi:hypothetical protein EDD11_001078 [Mortierella claussenii]|nr:hypothetical protein EDD11_001078 [Mortierella claussenii]